MSRSRKSPARRAASGARSTSPSAVSRIAEEIRRGIKEGRYAPGQRLIESDLTRTLGVSRGPLREAMARLAGDGLVTIEPNRGAMVRSLTREEVRSISAIRESLEGLAARLAAGRIEEGNNLAEFKRVWQELASTKSRASALEYVLANERFHTAIVKLSGNAPLAQLLEQMRTPVYRFQFRSRLTLEAIGRGHEDHSEVAAAIIAGDPDRAERAMRRHLRNSAKLIDSLPDDAFG